MPLFSCEFQDKTGDGEEKREERRARRDKMRREMRLETNEEERKEREREKKGKAISAAFQMLIDEWLHWGHTELWPPQFDAH